MHSLTRTLSLSLTIVTVLASLANASITLSYDTITIPRKPVVFYHGMGDSAHSEGMKELFASITDIDPNIFIHSIYVRLLGGAILSLLSWWVDSQLEL